MRYIFKLLDSRKNAHRQSIEEQCSRVVELYIEGKDKRRNNEAAPDSHESSLFVSLSVI